MGEARIARKPDAKGFVSPIHVLAFLISVSHGSEWGRRRVRIVLVQVRARFFAAATPVGTVGDRGGQSAADHARHCPGTCGQLERAIADPEATAEGVVEGATVVLFE